MTGSDPSADKRNKQQRNATTDLPPAVIPGNNQPNPQHGSSETDQPPSDHNQVIACWTKVVGVFTALLTVATGISAYFLWHTDETLQKTLAFNQRAWISVDVALAGPFRFDKDGDGRASVPLEIVIKNTGLSPAQDVRVIPTMYVGEAPSITDEELKTTRCRQPRAGASFGTTSFTLFPGQSVRMVLAPSLAKNEVAALKEKAASNGPKRYFFAPPVLVCVSYFALVDESFHFTTVIGVLFEKNPINPDLISGVTLDGPTIPASRLSLVPMGSFAD